MFESRYGRSGARLELPMPKAPQYVRRPVWLADEDVRREGNVILFPTAAPTHEAPNEWGWTIWCRTSA